MKLLHTADWHLGKIVNSVHMTEDQALILEQIKTIIDREQPDAVIVAGDLYDRAIPPRDAVELLNNTWNWLIGDKEIPVLSISGNHDSPDRLDFGSQLFKASKLYIETKLRPGMTPVTLVDAHGPVHFHLIPYTEPADVRAFFGDNSITTHQRAMEQIISYITDTYDMTERHVFVGHAFLAGGMESDSEERLSMIGGSPYVDAALFKPFTYAAFGHLHQAQRIVSDHIRYSGSPLKYSFSEANHKKSVTMVELDAAGFKSFEKIDLVPERDMRIVEGYFDDLMERLAGNPNDYLHIRLLDDGQLLDPMGKLRKLYPNILRLERKAKVGASSMSDIKQIKEKQRMSHMQLFAAFYEEMKGEAIPEHRQTHMEAVIQRLIEQERRS
ncbi:exonuclease sbcCD subunit D [Terribacillus saccharophilus]|uniref:Nuclease SbcCD subunit D n=1 Tax=Terribacillus saccharophilus TaxID=361277 RepID=A0A268HFQ7_9BACI|nr:exonuclease SbcCD subunit D [Terribacillus saccharophilus]PAE08713.1 exonuclease sbcCD subunit D [Terribacillus saccharophilus]